MKGVLSVDKLREVDRVTVVSSSGSIYFNRIGGVWINHIKSETLNDDDMGKLLANYEAFGWNTIFPQPITGFASDKCNPEQIDVGMDAEQAGELIIPEYTWMVIITTRLSTGRYNEFAYIHDMNASKATNKKQYKGPTGSNMTLNELRYWVVKGIEDGYIHRAQSFDKDQKMIGHPGRKA